MNIEDAYRLPGHPAAFSGITQLTRQFPGENVKQYLSSVDSYTRHRQGKKPRFRNPIYVYNRRELLQTDLADVQSLAPKNNNIRYLLLCIDTFSRRAWIRPLPNKSAAVVTVAMKSVLDEIGEPVKRLLSDSGTEYTAMQFQRLLKEYNIKHTRSTSEVKSPHVERFTGTFKRLMHMYMTENETLKYIDQLDNLLASYNSRFHRSINMSPNMADDPKNRDIVIDVLNRKRYGPIAQKRSKSEPAFKVGDIVRLKIHPGAFKKGHSEQFTGEMFKIHSIIDTLPITQFEVTNYAGDEVVRGRFGSSELQLCTNPVFKIEKVLESRRAKNGKLQHKVKWLHFGSEFNEWINHSDIEAEYDNG
jgi:hypothetical protein